MSFRDRVDLLGLLGSIGGIVAVIGIFLTWAVTIEGTFTGLDILNDPSFDVNFAPMVIVAAAALSVSTPAVSLVARNGIPTVLTIAVSVLALLLMVQVFGSHGDVLRGFGAGYWMGLIGCMSMVMFNAVKFVKA